MPFCPNCGKEVEQDAKFCPACGREIAEPVRSAESEIDKFTPEGRQRYIEELRASREEKMPAQKTGITKRKLAGIIIGCVIVVSVVIVLVSKLEEQTSIPIPPPAEQSTLPSTEVELNCGKHATVTHQQIIDTITADVTRELEFEDYDYRLKKITIEDKKIRVYLDLHFVPPSKEWIVHEGELWVGFVAAGGIEDDNHNLIGIIYETGYDISVLMWTWYEDTNKVIPWGHAIIFNSGQPITSYSIANEWQWIDGAGMKMFE